MDIVDSSIEEYKTIARDYWTRYAMTQYGMTEGQARTVVATCMIEGTFKNIAGHAKAYMAAQGK